MEMEKLINTLNELSAELATQPETWKQMAIIKAISTIEALQQEYDELDTGHSKLFKAYCEMKQEAEQLQAQNGAMRQQLEIIKDNIHEFPPEGMTIGKQIWIDTTDKALSADAGTDYHNPADVEALRMAREAIVIAECKCYAETFPQHSEECPEISSTACTIVPEKRVRVVCKRCKAIAAIDKIGGQEE